MINDRAYKLSDIRKFKSDKDGKEKLYDFCSPHFTDHTKPTSEAFPKLEYLGTGLITEIGGVIYSKTEPKEKLHFWKHVY